MCNFYFTPPPYHNLISYHPRFVQKLFDFDIAIMEKKFDWLLFASCVCVCIKCYYFLIYCKIAQAKTENIPICNFSYRYVSRQITAHEWLKCFYCPHFSVILKFWFSLINMRRNYNAIFSPKWIPEICPFFGQNMLAW